MAKDSLIKFSNAIINEAEEQKKQLLNKIKAENSVLIENKKALLKNQKKDYIAAETEKIESRKNLKLSLQSRKLRAELIKTRDSLVLDMFEKIKKKLVDYTKTESYFSKLKADFTNALESFPNEYIIISAKIKDIEYLSSLTNESFTFEEADEAILGGFTLICREKRIFMDYTLRTRLEEEKKDFILNSGFTIC